MKISDEIIKVLEFLCEKIGLTIDWTSENIIPFVEQLCTKFISWEIATSIAWIALSIVFIIIGFCLIKPAKNRWKKYDEDSYAEGDLFLCILFYTIAIVLMIVAIFVIPTQVFDIIECCTFPEKAIYDYIQFHVSSN